MEKLHSLLPKNIMTRASRTVWTVAELQEVFSFFPGWLKCSFKYYNANSDRLYTALTAWVVRWLSCRRARDLWTVAPAGTQPASFKHWNFNGSLHLKLYLYLFALGAFLPC